jgi:hypothetical protein
MDLLDNEHDPGLNIEQVLDRYETFHNMHMTIYGARFLGPAPAQAATGTVYVSTVPCSIISSILKCMYRRII